MSGCVELQNDEGRRGGDREVERGMRDDVNSPKFIPR